MQNIVLTYEVLLGSWRCHSWREIFRYLQACMWPCLRVYVCQCACVRALEIPDESFCLCLLYQELKMPISKMKVVLPRASVQGSKRLLSYLLHAWCTSVLFIAFKGLRLQSTNMHSQKTASGPSISHCKSKKDQYPSTLLEWYDQLSRGQSKECTKRLFVIRHCAYIAAASLSRYT